VLRRPTSSAAACAESLLPLDAHADQPLIGGFSGQAAGIGVTLVVAAVATAVSLLLAIPLSINFTAALLDQSTKPGARQRLIASRVVESPGS
jgi:ABC-type phosphate/phosphonate transport system permease subunit